MASTRPARATGRRPVEPFTLSRPGMSAAARRSIGPSGFARYARLFHPVGPDDDVIDPHHLEDLEGDLDPDVLGRLLSVLARHTTTPQDCFFCLSDGFGDIHGSPRSEC